MNISRRALILSVLIFFVGCGQEVKTSSGAGSGDVCSTCMDIIVTNNATFPVVVSGSGKTRLIFPNQTATFKYKNIDWGDNVILLAQRANSSGAAVGLAIEEDFRLRGGWTDSWLIETSDFD